MDVTLRSRATPRRGVLCQEVGGELVLLDLESERYFGLDPIGARIWGLLAGDGALQAVYDAVLSEYQVAPGELERDLIALVRELEAAGLLKVG